VTETEAELFAAIAADPDSDGPRLVYADWLLDKGDPRGEWIQLECQKKRIPERDPRWKDVVSASNRLWERHKRTWNRGGEVRYERGIVVGVNVRVDRPDPAASVRALLAVEPVLWQVRLYAWAEDSHRAARTFAASDVIPRLRHLDFSAAFYNVEAEDESARGMPDGGLQAWYIERTERFGDDLVTGLLEQGPLPLLRRVELQGSGVSDERARALALRLPHLEQLNLSRTRLLPETRSALRSVLGERVLLDD
jgi:uncharacterized protein (TIGR02996 family)